MVRYRDSSENDGAIHFALFTLRRLFSALLTTFSPVHTRTIFGATIITRLVAAIPIDRKLRKKTCAKKEWQLR